MLKTISLCRNRVWKRTITTRPQVIYDDQTKSFLSLFPEIVDTIIKSKLFSKVPQYQKHFIDVLEYNVMKEKRFRAPLILETYKILEKPENLTDENLRLANIFSWCMEIIHTYMNVEDDTMDETGFRCNDISWYQKENVGLSAFKDSLFFYEAASIVLKKYFYKKPTYLQFVELCHKMNQSLVIGQSLDWHLKMNKILDFSKFNTNFFKRMSRSKGDFIIIESPFMAGCILSDNYERYLKVEELIQIIGHFFQVDNDVYDVFQHGKIKTDVGENIRQGQCTWMAVQVLEKGSQEQIRIFKENYRRPGAEFENTVINIYHEMDLFGKYMEYRSEIFKYIQETLSRLNDPLLEKAVLNLYNKIFM